MRATIKWLGVVLVALLVLASCGSDSPQSATDTSATDASDTPAEMADDEMADDEMADEEMAEMSDDEMAEMEDTDHAEEFEFGEPAEASEADRVIELVTMDDFTYTPASIEIAVGEVVTFRATNEGLIAHDFTLGDSLLQDEHDAEMLEMAGMMMQDEPNAFGLEPGETKEVTWRFTEAGELLIGCHVPGHYAAGMKAEITVTS